MRPRTLELEGFGAFRDPTVIDFADTDLFALQGPTGAGKSTVIDAICFALYGNVPRYDDQRLVAAAMSSHAVEMRVRLRFELAGMVYDVVRVVRRTGPGRVSTKEARLEIVDGDVLAGREGELRTQIEGLLGLTFDDFTRCVVLPQGSFARFLHDKPADRQGLLVRLLDLGVYGRMLQRANTRAGELERDIAFVDGHLAGLADVTPESIEELVESLVVLARTTADIADRVPIIESGFERARQTSLVARDHAGWLELLDGVEMPAGLVDLAERIAEARRQADDAEVSHGAAVDLVDRLSEASRSGPRTEAVEASIARRQRHQRGAVVVAELADQLGHATKSAEQSEADTQDAAIAATAAAAALGELRAEHLAHTLAVELRSGEECPVCHQLVERLPLSTIPAALAAAEASVARADRALAEARRNADIGRRELDRIVDRKQQARELFDELAAELVGVASDEELRAQLIEAAELERSATAARTAEQLARRQVDQARKQLETLDRDQQRFDGTMHRQRDALVGLGAPAPVGGLVEAWAALAQWAQARRPEVETEYQRLRGEARSLTDRADRDRSELVSTVRAVGVEASLDASVETVVKALDRRRDGLDRQLADGRAALEKRGTLVEQRERLVERRRVAVELGRLLKADRFQRWLVEETLAELAARASGRLLTMSNGRFSIDLNPNGEFAVIDHGEGDERRGVRTLSGGETFQTSLALALALSDHLVELSGRRGHALESIFLDEGFGTLDSESLDAVASTIELLGSDGRMVGIVTHVAALAERMPVRYLVSRGPRSAMVERVVA